MKKELTIKIRRVEVSWIDSISDKIIWQWIPQAIKDAKTSKEIFKSIGYLIYQNKKITLIASSLHFPYEGEKTKTIDRAGTLFTIPTGAIIKIKRFNL